MGREGDGACRFYRDVKFAQEFKGLPQSSFHHSVGSGVWGGLRQMAFRARCLLVVAWRLLEKRWKKEQRAVS